MSHLLHESLFRRPPLMRRLAATRVTVCGAGALGSNLVETLARGGFNCLRSIDRDRVEARNLSTQPWQRGDVGAMKATLLSNNIYRAVRVEVEAHSVELTAINAARLLRGSDVVVDTFDNSASRRLVHETCARLRVPCLHVGLADGYAEVLWDEAYRIPSDPFAPGEDVCDYPLARSLVLLAVAAATEALVTFVDDGTRRGHAITLRDLTISDAVHGPGFTTTPDAGVRP